METNQCTTCDITVTHDTDFYSWTQRQADLLRQGRFHDLDTANLIEEVEDMGRSERRGLESRLAVLLMHLLKRSYQPQRRGNSWRLTIANQRFQSRRLLKQNPGLKSDLGDSFEAAYYTARLRAAQETHLEPGVFPLTCPWSLTQTLDDDYWPE